MLGDVDSGAAAIADAEALGRRLNHVPSLAHALWLKAKYATVARDPRTALAAAEEVLALAREFRLAVYEASALSHKGWALVHLGEVEEGNQLLEAGLAMWRSQRSSMLLPHRLCLLAEGRLAAGRRDEALAIIDEALDQIEQTNEQFLASKARLIQSEVLLLGGPDERERGQNTLAKALEVARRQSARSMELRISTRFARLWAEQGERQRAHDFLAPILGSFASDLDGTDLKEARELLQVL
jgi:predicted ATPase